MSFRKLKNDTKINYLNVFTFDISTNIIYIKNIYCLKKKYLFASFLKIAVTVAYIQDTIYGIILFILDDDIYLHLYY